MMPEGRADDFAFAAALRRQLTMLVLVLGGGLLVLLVAAIGGTIGDMVRQMLNDRRAAGDALIWARVALAAAQGDAARLREQLREVEDAQSELAELRIGQRIAA